MRCKIGLAVLFAASLLSTSAFSITEHTFHQGIAYEFILPANEPQIFTNTFFWSIESTCTIISETENNPFSFKVLRKSGTLNGSKLLVGDTMDLVVHPGEQLYITAVSGARVELINHGETTIKASCSASK